MKKRNDFVSNSSSTSFILKNDDDKKRYQRVFSNHKIISVNKLIEVFTKIKDNLSTNFTDLENLVGGRYDSGRIFEDTFNDLEMLRNGICEKIDILNEINQSDSDVYITEPTNRDHAYELNVSDLNVFEGDL